MKLILLIFFIFCLFTIGVASISLAPWVPSRKKDLKRIFKLANLKSNEVFYDLGCGDGRIAAYANKHYNVKAIGIELALPLFLICKIRQLFNKDKFACQQGGNLIFKFKNLFKENLSQADAVYFFGMPNKLKHKLKQKLEKELMPGARVISYAFPVEGWVPKVVDKPSKNDIAIYLYKL